MGDIVSLDVRCFTRPFADATQERVRREAAAVAAALDAAQRGTIRLVQSPAHEFETERLGPAGAMRFMMQYDPGHGDCSKDRHESDTDRRGAY